MSASNELEQNELWRKARALVQAVEPLVNALPHSEAWTLANPIHQIAISLTSDIANAIGRDSKDAELDYRYARGHLLTIKSMLLIAKDLGYLTSLESVLVEIEVIRRILDDKIDEFEESAETEENT